MFSFKSLRKGKRAEKSEFNFDTMAEIIDSEGVSVIEMLLLGSDPHVLHEIRSRYHPHFSPGQISETHPGIGV